MVHLSSQHKERLVKYGTISFFTATIVFIVGTFLAMITYPDYSFLTQFFSELGVRADTISPSDGTLFQKAPYPELFNGSLYIAGLLIFPFFILTTLLLWNESLLSNIFLLLSTLTGSLVGPFLIGVGYYDLARDWDAHVWWAITLYQLIAVTTFLWTVAILSMPGSHEFRSNKKWIYDIIFFALLLLTTFINIENYVPPIFPLNLLEVAAYQKLMAYFFIAYFGIIVSLRLKKYVNSLY